MSNIINSMSVSFRSIPSNVGFARVAISAFAAQLDPTVDELADIKTAVSEAVTNAIVHGYDSEPSGIVKMDAKLYDDGGVEIEIEDLGIGIDDIPKAREPFFTTKPELDRSGMGFTVMESFMDRFAVESAPGVGTRIFMKKRILAGGTAETAQNA